MTMQKNNAPGTLYIDSTAFDAVQFAFVPLDENQKVIAKVYTLLKRNTQTASFLKRFLKSAIDNDMTRIAAFAVKVGEGSFAGMRTGISLALGMGFALDLPVYSINAKGNAKLITSAAEIDYGAAPNIGVTKKKVLKQMKTA
jgi:tRNA A37 threonylcarbamoyladenosine modification protein TsaB